jgi:hypothetical protein
VAGKVVFHPIKETLARIRDSLPSAKTRQSLYLDSATHVSFARAARVYGSRTMAGRGHSLKSPAGTDVVPDSPGPVRPFIGFTVNFF